MAAPAAGGGGKSIGKPPAGGNGGGGGGSGMNRPPNGGAGRGGVNRHADDDVTMSFNNTWLMHHLLFRRSYNQPVTSAPAHPVSAMFGDEMRSFRCEPQEGQLARDWQRQCEAPGGQYRMKFARNCEARPAETARGWVERCALRFQPDW